MSLIKINREIDPALEKELLIKNRKLRENFLWIFANEDVLRKKYANKYIAVKNKDVRFVSDTIEELISTINSSQKQIHDYAIQYITKEPANFLF